MSSPIEREPRQFQLAQIADAAEQYEDDLVRSGDLPDVDRLLVRRIRRPLEWIGAGLVGALIGLLAIWFVHLAVNDYLHYGAG